LSRLSNETTIPESAETSAIDNHYSDGTVSFKMSHQAERFLKKLAILGEILKRGVWDAQKYTADLYYALFSKTVGME